MADREDPGRKAGRDGRETRVRLGRGELCGTGTSGVRTITAGSRGRASSRAGRGRTDAEHPRGGAKSAGCQGPGRRRHHPRRFSHPAVDELDEQAHPGPLRAVEERQEDRRRKERTAQTGTRHGQRPNAIRAALAPRPTLDATNLLPLRAPNAPRRAPHRPWRPSSASAPWPRSSILPTTLEKPPRPTRSVRLSRRPSRARSTPASRVTPSTHLPPS
jgi:hypothetical protein